MTAGGAPRAAAEAIYGSIARLRMPPGNDRSNLPKTVPMSSHEVRRVGGACAQPVSNVPRQPQYTRLRSPDPKRRACIFNGPDQDYLRGV
jgi:hypothetical protein